MQQKQMKGVRRLKKRVEIKGVIIPNDYKWYYDWLKMDATCVNDVKAVVETASDSDEIEVYINSPGGVIDAGSEIYSILRNHSNVKIFITGQACSAASVIAMSAHCEMSPTALMMVHCTSTQCGGNHSCHEKTAKVLKTADTAICQAYMLKSGMTEKEALEMMEEETWLTAEQAKEKKLIDAVMFKQVAPVQLSASSIQMPTQEQMELVRNMLDQSNDKDIDNEMETDESHNESSDFIKTKMNFLKLKGGIR